MGGGSGDRVHVYEVSRPPFPKTTTTGKPFCFLSLSQYIYNIYRWLTWVGRLVFCFSSCSRRLLLFLRSRKAWAWDLYISSMYFFAAVTRRWVTSLAFVASILACLVA